MQGINHLVLIIKVRMVNALRILSHRLALRIKLYGTSALLVSCLILFCKQGIYKFHESIYG